jgi:TatD DNase family protein
VEQASSISYFDSHCHLQDGRLLAGIDGVLSRAKSAGVTVLSCCGSSEGDWDSVKKLSGAYPWIVPSFGLHPWYVADRSADWEKKLTVLLTENPAACVGEIGIDHVLDKSTFADQETVFLRQLAIAVELSRPVTIHCVRAFGRLIELLRQAGGVFQGGIVHSYSGPPELVKTCEWFGLSISFSGSISFPGNKRARASVRAVSPDRLCLETDSPDIKPNGWNAALNEPASITLVANAAAEVLGVSEREVVELTFKNSSRIFMGRS